MKHAFAESPLLPLTDASPITIDRDEVEIVPALPPQKSGKVPSYLSDHRKRLRHRFLTGGAKAMPDYEILELTLFRIIPRQDVKPLARRLIDTFGDLNGVLSAPIARLDLIADEEQASGTVDHVPVYPREVVKRALELNASAMILVHNHPSGDPTPSDEDIAMTNQIAQAATALNISLHDHLIIGRSRELSFKSQGLL